MIVRSGIDLVEINRLEGVIQQYGERFLQRIYCTQERNEAGHSTASLAARFAAKEAVAKALGCGIGLVNWKEIEVRHTHNGEPKLHLYGKAAEIARELRLQSWSISISHTNNLAMALVVAIGE